MWWIFTAFAGPLDGDWAYVGGEQQLTRVEAVRSTILDQFNVIVRPIVATHLRYPFTVHQVFRFEPQGDAVRVSMVGDAPQTYTVPIDGTVLAGPEGSVQLRGDPTGFVLDLMGPEQGHITYDLHPNGDQMQVRTTISSPRMEGVHSWVLTYKRKQPAGKTSGL